MDRLSIATWGHLAILHSELNSMTMLTEPVRPTASHNEE